MTEAHLPQEFIVRCPDGVLTGAAVYLQQCLLNDEGEVIYRLGTRIVDLPESEKEELATALGLKYNPPQPTVKADAPIPEVK